MTEKLKHMTISITTGTIFKVILIGLSLWFLWFIKEIVAMLFVALLLAALIEPFAAWLHRHKIPRGFGVIAIYVVLFALISVLLILIIPPLIEQSSGLAQNFSNVFAGIQDSIGRLYAFGEQYGFEQDIQSSLEGIRDNIGSVLSRVFSTITGFVGGVVSLAVILVLAFYMVVEEDAWRRFFRRVAPDEYQPYLTQLFTRMQTKIGQWMRGQLLLITIISAASYVGLLALGMPYALVLALFAGMMELIPYAGPTISAIPAVVIAFTISPLTAILVLILYIVIQQIEGNILTPTIMKKVAGLNPIASIIALLVGFKVGGIAGAIVAIPVATMLSVFFYDVFQTAKK